MDESTFNLEIENLVNKTIATFFIDSFNVISAQKIGDVGYDQHVINQIKYIKDQYQEWVKADDADKYDYIVYVYHSILVSTDAIHPPLEQALIDRIAETFEKWNEMNVMTKAAR